MLALLKAEPRLTARVVAERLGITQRIGEPPTRSRGKTGSLRRCCSGYLNLEVVPKGSGD
ncbi:hypothetical protein [Methanoculleus sp.]|uniref:hypothetical protein n=1 Tax=Methanoculleus sp. TaxID=90427 RepID=UPI00344FE291